VSAFYMAWMYNADTIRARGRGPGGRYLFVGGLWQSGR